MRALRRFGIAALAVLTAAGMAAPTSGVAQERVTVLSAGGDPDQPDLDLTRTSLFDLAAEGDEGSVGIRSGGSASWCYTNVSGFGQYFRLGCASPQYHRGQDGDTYSGYFDFGLNFSTPPSDLPDVIDPAESGLVGGGYTANVTTIILGSAVKGGSDKLWASDRTGAELLALGVQGTDDSSCTNFTSEKEAFLRTGFQLLPASDCPPTIPPSGWKGGHPIEAEAYLEMQVNDPAFYESDPFAFWRVPPELQRTDRRLGDFSTYGELSDHYLQAIQRYGAVVPGGSGAPEYEGYPHGLTIFFDAFYFGLPTISNASYWQATIVNESEKVYGVGMTYDSLYIGINYDPLLGSQNSAQYTVPEKGAILHNVTGNDCANAPDSTRCRSDDSSDGFFSGVGGIAILKSPIGDLRYKLLTDPNSEFYDPAHPRAGDTITFQHQHMCGFGGCAPNTMQRGQRAHFGLYSSTGSNVLDGRTPADIQDGDYQLIYRNGHGGNKTGQFNKYVPGVDDNAPIWDWNKDGVPDTIYADNCGRDGCVALYGDTLPNGYTMRYGNVSAMSVGPVSIAPGDTVPFVVALLGAADSTSMASLLNNTIDFYQRFFLGPEAAPTPTIAAVDVNAGQRFAGDVPGNSITLYFDDATEDWVDPFLSTLDVSVDLPLNPWLPDSIAALEDNNVQSLYVFKSCDGSTFTDDGDCDGDPVGDPTSKWASFGWQPYATLEADDDGELPNTFTDENVIPGVTYTYVIVSETRGAEFNLVRGGEGDLTAETVAFAPSLLSSLSSAATNPNVALVYVPLNLAAGAQEAQLNVLNRTGSSTVPVNVNVIGTAPTGGQYRTVFVDSLQVTQVENLVDGQVESVQTTVTGYLTRTVTDAEGNDATAVLNTFEFDRSGTVSTSGLTEVSMEASESQRTTVLAGNFGLILATAGNTPLLASTTLTGDAATPGGFIGREDFPFFRLSVDESAGGTLDEELFVGPQGDTIPSQVEPSVNWLTGGGQSTYLAGGDYGTFQLTWSDDSFGPQVPFNVADRANVGAAFQASIAARAAGSQSSTSAEALDAIKAVNEDVTIDASELVAYNLPFDVRNVTYDRDVTVVVTRHPETLVLGQGNDTIRVDAPQDAWLPGDELHFVETVTQEVTDENGNVVLGAGGQPETETVQVATFRAVLGCLAPRTSCDPTVGGAQSSGYIAAAPGTLEEVQYLVPLRSGDEFVFEVLEAVTAEQAAAAGEVSLENVHVAPNPYIFANEFERNTADRVLKFTNLPPEGRIRIFDVAGRFVQELNYVPEDLRGGDLDWDLRTRENLELAAGLYVFVLETDEGDRKMGKFVVIR